MTHHHLGRLSESSLARRRERAETRSRRFIRGPIPLDWISRASKLGGKSCAVALAIRYKHGVTKQATELKISPKLLEQFGVGTKTGAHLLGRLASANLITLNQARGKCPVVSILEVEE